MNTPIHTELLTSMNHNLQGNDVEPNTTSINKVSDTSIKLNLIRIIRERGSIDCFEALFGRLPNAVELDSLRQLQKGETIQ